MALTVKLLGAGPVPAAPTAPYLYTVPTGKSAVIQTISLVNTHTSEVTFNLFVVTGGNSRTLVQKDTTLSAGLQAILDDIITLGAGDSIKADSNTDGKIDAVVCGVERDA